jgi:cytochrome c-type biogenesis protein CcmH/NrfG
MKDNLNDGEAIKNKIALAKLKENGTAEYVEELNCYLEQSPTDSEAWLELADIYMKFFE